MEKTREEIQTILNNMVWSYSSMNAFKTCPLSFKFSYLDKVKNREGNIFSELGNISHFVMEEYFKGNVEVYELDKLFIDNYDKFVTYNAPTALQKFNYEENTKDKLLKFFNNTDIDNLAYEPLCMEDKYLYEIEGIKIVIKPDLIIRRKADGKVILWDYKTSGYKKDSHAEYAYQCSLYAKIYEIVTGTHIDEMNILYFKETVKPRGKPIIYGRFVPLEYNENVLERFVSDVKKIFNAETWEANLDDFFCQNICSYRNGTCEEKAIRYDGV